MTEAVSHSYLASKIHSIQDGNLNMGCEGTVGKGPHGHKTCCFGVSKIHGSSKPQI